jgi:hypothetical protein
MSHRVDLVQVPQEYLLSVRIFEQRLRTLVTLPDGSSAQARELDAISNIFRSHINMLAAEDRGSRGSSVIPLGPGY